MGVFERRRFGRKNTQQMQDILQNRDLTKRVSSNDSRSQLLDSFLSDLNQRVGQSVSAAVSIASCAPTLRVLGADAEVLGHNLSDASATIANTSEEITTTLAAELVPGTADMLTLSSSVVAALHHCESESDSVLSHIGGISGSEEQLRDAIEKLQSQLEEVSQVIGVIADISKRTNLLSLNAAIEAARAGAHGKGFSVVAEEVRRLAQHTTEATDQVTSIIESFRVEMGQLRSAGSQMQNAVQEGEAGVNGMRSQLIDVRESMDQLNDKVSAITTGTEQIGVAVSAMNQDVHTVSVSARQMLDSAVQFSDMAGKVHDLSDRLLEGGLGGFKLALHNQAQATIEVVAEDNEIIRGGSDRVNRALRRVIDEDPKIELLYLVDRNGRQISDNVFAADLDNSQGHLAKGRDWSDRHWFRAVIAGDSAHITDVYRSAATDTFCFTVAVPVRNKDGELVRVLGADIRLSALME